MSKSDIKGGKSFDADHGDQDPKTGPEFGLEGATRDEVNPSYEGGKSKPQNQTAHYNELATAGVDHPSDKREVHDE